MKNHYTFWSIISLFYYYTIFCKEVNFDFFCLGLLSFSLVLDHMIKDFKYKKINFIFFNFLTGLIFIFTLKSTTEILMEKALYTGLIFLISLVVSLLTFFTYKIMLLISFNIDDIETKR